MITKEGMDEIIRAYFNMKDAMMMSEMSMLECQANHKVVVDVLKVHPEYAVFFLTSEERGEDE